MGDEVCGAIRIRDHRGSFDGCTDDDKAKNALQTSDTPIQLGDTDGMALMSRRSRIALLVIAVVFVGTASGFVIVSSIHWIAERLAARHPEVLYFVKTDQRVVALTIDDGPDPVTTPKILDVLRHNGTHATFFIITEHIPGNEQLLKRIVKEGHELANHLTRDEPSIKLPPEQFTQELISADQILKKYADVSWFRPGAGRFNEAMLSTVSEHGYRCALGSVYPLDPYIPSSWFASQFILWAMHPGAVIVLHDVGARGERTAETLWRVLPRLKRNGYLVITLSGLVGLESAK